MLRPALRVVARVRVGEVFTAAALLTVIVTALLANLAGLSVSLGAFLAGVLLADSEFRHELEADLEPFKGLLLGLFFIVGRHVGESRAAALGATDPARRHRRRSCSIKVLPIGVLGRLAGQRAERGVAAGVRAAGRRRVRVRAVHTRGRQQILDAASRRSAGAGGDAVDDARDRCC